MQLDSLAFVEGVVEDKYIGGVLDGVRAGVRCVLARLVQMVSLVCVIGAAMVHVVD